DGQDPDAQQPDAERAEEPDAAASEPTPDADDDDSDDAFRDGALTEVDGVYDIVPAERGGLDVLYDMLSSFDEDSVTIYAGLVHPKDGHHETTGPIVVEDEEIVQDQEIVQDEEEMTGLVPRMEPITPPASEPDATPASDSQPETQQPADPAADEPEQLSLIEDVEEPAPRPKPRSRRKRASIPSWDEIMFGAPHAPNNDEK
ncbi:MAG: hypothetical protein Q4F65_06495, partial [Propionibacteriaceae bacterium]|nr:hypothetical protein [Propionibacteriaceae bacterium]